MISIYRQTVDLLCRIIHNLKNRNTSNINKPAAIKRSQFVFSEFAIIPYVFPAVQDKLLKFNSIHTNNLPAINPL